MNKSETISKLAGALARAQGEMQAAQMNAVNPFFKNRYADLGSVIETAKPTLAKYGLAVSQMPTTLGLGIGVTTILMHESGEWIEDTVSLPLGEEKGKSSAQVAGSVITYLRRYSLASVLGMYADEDADGAEIKPKPQQKAAAATKSGERPMAADTLKAAVERKIAGYQKAGKKVSPGARGLLVGMLENLFDDNKEENRHKLTDHLVGQTSTKDMSDAMCAALLDWVADVDLARAEAAMVLASGQANKD